MKKKDLLGHRERAEKFLGSDLMGFSVCLPTLNLNLFAKLQSLTFFHHCIAKMLTRALRSGRALPLRRNAFTPIVKRTVTMDAASSHAEKEHVPEVRLGVPTNKGIIGSQLDVSLGG